MAKKKRQTRPRKKAVKRVKAAKAAKPAKAVKLHGPTLLAKLKAPADRELFHNMAHDLPITTKGMRAMQSRIGAIESFPQRRIMEDICVWFLGREARERRQRREEQEQQCSGHGPGRTEDAPPPADGQEAPGDATDGADGTDGEDDEALIEEFATEVGGLG